MQNFLAKIKAFNSKHRKIAPFLIWIEIAIIFLASVIKNICRHYKILLTAAVILIAIGISARHLAVAKTTSSESPDIIETNEIILEDDASDIQTTDSYDSEASFADSQISDKEVTVEDSSVNLEDADNVDDEATEKGVEFANVDSDISEFMESHAEAVGWIRFEDDLISYPIMQASDNSRYALKDPDGNDSETGSIFLDYRSSADFSDSNTIIYGHNMKNRTMFGALKVYKEDISFLDNDEHKYFQIITPEVTSRYLMFAFMDVPKNSYIYDVCGDDTSRMREFLDTIEYKTYIDTGIEPDVDDKIITLSTCTQKDDLYFVMFAVKVEN